MSDITIGKIIERYEGGGNKLVYINLGFSCNQKCVFCILEGNEEKFPNMPTEEVKGLIKGFLEDGGESIMFTGGEPSLRNDLPELVSYAESFPTIKEVSILTNGTFLDDEKMEKILGADKKNILSFSVSLHSHFPEISKELTRGQDGDFEKTVSTIKKLQARTRNVSVYQVITAKNYKYLPEFVSFIRKEAPNVRCFVFAYPFAQGAAEKNGWIYVKLSELKEYLLKAIEMIRRDGCSIDMATCGQTPLCVIPGNEEIILRTMDYFSENMMGTIGGNVFHEFEWADKGWIGKYKNKPDVCKECALNEVCQGFWNKYVEMFEFDGVSPVTPENFKGNLITVPSLSSDEDVSKVKKELKTNILNLIDISREAKEESIDNLKQYALNQKTYIAFHKNNNNKKTISKMNITPIDMGKLNIDEVKRIYDASRRIGSLASLSWIEIFAAYFGLKPSMAEANTGTYNDNAVKRFSETAEICKSIGMTFAASNHKYIINSPRGIFEEIPLDDKRDGCVILGISKDPKKAVSAVAHYHLKSKDTRFGRSFGELMGYPSCCLDFGDYLANTSSDPNNFGFKNPAIETLKRSDELAWQLNVFSTKSFLSHFSCSFNCKQSIDYVDNFLKLLTIADPAAAEETIRSLKDPVSLYWTCVDQADMSGEYIKNDKMFRAGEARYDNRTIKWGGGSDTFYQNNDAAFLSKIASAKEALAQGNKVVATTNEITIYADNDELLKFKKDNEFLPLLIKPTM